MEAATIKEDPGPREEDESNVSCTEINNDLPDDKKECLEHTGKITKTKGNFVLTTFNNCYNITDIFREQCSPPQQYKLIMGEIIKEVVPQRRFVIAEEGNLIF